MDTNISAGDVFNSKYESKKNKSNKKRKHHSTVLNHNFDETSQGDYDAEKSNTMKKKQRRKVKLEIKDQDMSTISQSENHINFDNSEPDTKEENLMFINNKKENSRKKQKLQNNETISDCSLANTTKENNDNIQKDKVKKNKNKTNIKVKDKNNYIMVDLKNEDHAKHTEFTIKEVKDKLTIYPNEKKSKCNKKPKYQNNVSILETKKGDDFPPQNFEKNKQKRNKKNKIEAEEISNVMEDNLGNLSISLKTKKQKLSKREKADGTQEFDLKKNKLKHSKKVTFDVPDIVVKNSHNFKNLDEDESAIKDEDIDKFCDELDEEDNQQYENWIKLFEENFHSKKKTTK